MNGFNTADYNTAQYNTAQFNTAQPPPSFGNVYTGIPGNTAYPQPLPPYQQAVQPTMVRKLLEYFEIYCMRNLLKLTEQSIDFVLFVIDQVDHKG